ncbi:hypothetical protein PanNE5_24830 [Pandoraea sp. NE5]|nr:hypothetical protein PanNE5_24830 [Pandoraea sp. NE5]
MAEADVTGVVLREGGVSDMASRRVEWRRATDDGRTRDGIYEWGAPMIRRLRRLR